VRALFYDDATVRAALCAPRTPEQIAQTEKDKKAFGRFARDPYLHNPDLPARLPRITCPAVVIAAEVDVVIPRAHSEAYARAIPGAVLRNLPRAAHGMHHERTDDVADEIIRWLTVSDAAPTVSMRAAVTEGFLVCRRFRCRPALVVPLGAKKH